MRPPVPGSDAVRRGRGMSAEYRRRSRIRPGNPPRAGASKTGGTRETVMTPSIRRLALSSALAAAVFAGGVIAVRAQEAQQIAERLAAIRDAAADRDAARVEKLVAEFDAARPGLDALDEARLLLGKTYLLANRAEDAAQAVVPVVDRAEAAW